MFPSAGSVVFCHQAGVTLLAMPNKKGFRVSEVAPKRWLEMLMSEGRFRIRTIRMHQRHGPWKGQHAADEQHMLVLCQRGSLSVACPGHPPFTLGHGELLWLPPMLSRQLSGSGSCHQANLRFTLITGQQLPVMSTTPQRYAGLNHASTLYQELRLAARDNSEFGILRQRGLLAALTVSCLETITTSDDDGLLPAQRSAVQRLLATDALAPYTPRDLARAAGLSLDYFTRQFRHSYGMPPRRYLLQERMRALADVLIESDEPIARLAAEHGYPNASAFGRLFAGIMGHSPGRWRKRARQGSSDLKLK